MLARVTSQQSGSVSKFSNVWLLWKWDVHFSEIISESLQERYAHCMVVKLELINYHLILSSIVILYDKMLLLMMMMTMIIAI